MEKAVDEAEFAVGESEREVINIRRMASFSSSLSRPSGRREERRDEEEEEEEEKEERKEAKTGGPELSAVFNRLNKIQRKLDREYIWAI